MKLFYLVLCVFMLGCKKEDSQVALCDVSLIIGNTESPKTAFINTGITFSYECFGNNLCYSFSGTGISQKSGNIFEIRAKGKFPCSAAICAQAIFQASDTITIKTPQAGSYYLQFFNENTLFKTDTVLVQ